jgi:hypothetical protein
MGLTSYGVLDISNVVRKIGKSFGATRHPQRDLLCNSMPFVML